MKPFSLLVNKLLSKQLKHLETEEEIRNVKTIRQMKATLVQEMHKAKADSNNNKKSNV
jgi:hypothetical protein